MTIGLSEQEKTYPLEDQVYIMERNALIPEASRYADQVCAGKGEEIRWDTIFFNRMNELAKARGLLKGA